MHEIPFSQLQRAIAVGGELQTRSEAHEADMVLTIAEEAALEEWCLAMYRWESPVRLDILRCMAAAILEDHERRNLDRAPDFFNRIMDPDIKPSKWTPKAPTWVPLTKAISLRQLVL